MKGRNETRQSNGVWSRLKKTVIFIWINYRRDFGRQLKLG